MEGISEKAGVAVKYFKWKIRKATLHKPQRHHLKTQILKKLNG